MMTRSSTIVLITAAGFATAPGFLDPFRARLHESFVQLGYAVRSSSLLPYGDWQRSKPQQLWEIYHDLRLRPEAYTQSIGGNRLHHWLARAAAGASDDPHHYVMVGHSGGGVAVVHAAYMLMQAQKRVLGVVQIGTPKCSIAEELQARTLYVRGMFRSQVKRSKRWVVDPITRMGGWGASIASPNRRVNPPGTIIDIPLIGGHPDYFRQTAPYVRDGVGSNETVTYRTVWSWITARLAAEAEHDKA
ncbi:hypothetical protein DUZ99_11865 [Xylanibacillus composti]|uniref:Fungal lipase-like domain-containing protein n=1 Tax=Xylanibacillus composti TaxID=1572762 RepID=A0A8J4H1B7_9BACL|nr:alpha/beta hydrolase [Xylanibacillus composti]MDT9725670.1 hypothetical protein [Xylanibacillus composti]GIQ67765.1 hypothetical protein XYCOK13_05890 [Xylanibacillus composti]